MPYKTIYLVVPRDPSSTLPPLAFGNSRISADTYIASLRLEDKLRVMSIPLYDEVQDAFDHAALMRACEIRGKLTREEVEFIRTRPAAI